MENGIGRLPDHILVQIFSKVGGPKEITRLAGVSRQWRSASRAHKLWETVAFEGSDRLCLYQLTAFIKSPFAVGVVNLCIEGFVIRKPEQGTQSTVTNSVLELIGRRMTKLKKFRIWNANICPVKIKSFPKRLESLSLEGCIIECNFLAALPRRNVLPRLKHLDLNYVHNLASYSDSFKAILKKKSLETVLLRHCSKIANSELSKLTFLPALTVLNVSEIAAVNDQVLKAFSTNFRLEKLYIAFTFITDAGISQICDEKRRKLRLLDIRGCVKVTSESLVNLEEKSRLEEVWISAKMPGAEGVREGLSRLTVHDEVTLNKLSIAMDLSKYTSHFAEVLQPEQDQDNNIVLENRMPVPDNIAQYFGR